MFRDEWEGQSGGVPYEYQNTFTPGPNPAPGLQTNAAAGINPDRQHAPIVRLKPWYEQDGAGSDTTIQRVPYTPDAYSSVPVLPVYVPAGGYQTPPLFMAHGWEQSFVPSEGRRPALVAMTPLLQLSRPIVSGKKSAVDQPKRKPIRFHSPKAKE